MSKLVRKFLKTVLPLSYLNSLRNSIIRKFRTYNYEKSGDKLAYSLTHLNSCNYEKKQKELLFGILKYAKDNVPYYKMIMNNIYLDKGLVINNLKDIPLLSKAIIREQGKNIYSDLFEKDFSYWKKTGGSTGEPLEFPVSKNFELVHGRCLYNIMGAKKNATIVAFDGTLISNDLLEKKIFWKKTGNDFPYGSVHYSALYMNDDNMNFYIDHLNSVKPSIMRGYPSGFEHLAKFLIKNKIELKFKLKGIYLTAESFDSSYIELLNSGLKCPVYGQYGHSEVSIFAFTLANSLEYICSPVYGYTEVLDEKGNHVKEGESGEVVVTGFSNKVMPFIRYKTGDIAVYGGTRNGVVKLKSLQGRTIDYILNNDNEKIYLTALGFSKRIKSFHKIKKWQFEQNKKGEITVRIVKDEVFSDLDELEIIQSFETFNLKATIEYVDHIPLTISGKRRFLIQNII